MTLALAVVGAITGLAALLAQVWQFTASGPRVKVTVANALGTNDGRWHVSIDLSNVGRLPVTIIDVGIVVERQGAKPGSMPIAGLDRRFWTGPALPHRLADGEAVTYLVSPDLIALSLADEHARADVRAYARLATDKRVKSRNRVDVMRLAQAGAVS